MDEIRRRSWLDNLRAARATPPDATFQQGGFAGILAKIGANIALQPLDIFHMVKEAPEMLKLVGTLNMPMTPEGQILWASIADKAKQAAAVPISQRLNDIAMNPPDPINLASNLAAPAAWKLARVAGYELLPQQMALYARSLAQRKSLQTYMPKRMNASVYDVLNRHHTAYTQELAEQARTGIPGMGNRNINYYTVAGLRREAAVGRTDRWRERMLNPEVLDAVKATLKKKLGRDVSEEEIKVMDFYSQKNPSQPPITGAVLKRIAEKAKETGTEPTWMTKDDLFSSLNKFYYVKEGDTYHVVDLYKFFPLDKGHEKVLPGAHALLETVKNIAKGNLEGGSGMGVMSAPQDIGVKYGSAYPVYWKVTKPD